MKRLDHYSTSLKIEVFGKNIFRKEIIFGQHFFLAEIITKEKIFGNGNLFLPLMQT